MQCFLILRIRSFSIYYHHVCATWPLKTLWYLNISGLVSMCVVYDSNIYQGPFLCQPVYWSRVLQWSAEVSEWVLEVCICFPHFLKANKASVAKSWAWEPNCLHYWFPALFLPSWMSLGTSFSATLCHLWNGDSAIPHHKAVVRLPWIHIYQVQARGEPWVYLPWFFFSE